MAMTRNKLIPIVAILALAIVGAVMWQTTRKRSTEPVAADAKSGAKPDGDSTTDTLRTVVASNKELRAKIGDVLEENRRLRAAGGMTREEIVAVATGAASQTASKQLNDARLAKAGEAAPGSALSATSGQAASAVGTGGVTSGGAVSGVSAKRPGLIDRVGTNVDQAIAGASVLIDGLKPNAGAANGAGAAPGAPGLARPSDMPAGLGFDGAGGSVGLASPMPAYRVVMPMGPTTGAGSGPGVGASNENRSGLVRTAYSGAAEPFAPSASVGYAMANLPAGSLPPGSVYGNGGVDAARTLGSSSLGGSASGRGTPYFTIPQNATLTQLSAMTSIIGRVPVGGQITDPMKFKAIIGRENLAANGLYVPDDLTGAVVSGIAIGDMAMSCSEGKVTSITFVFDDGTIRTVNAGRSAGVSGLGATLGGGSSSGAGAAQGGGMQALGWISDLHGNPCIAGKFVTNAPAYLTDIVGVRALGVGSRAYSAAQTSTTTGAVAGSETTSVTGNRGKFVMGQMAGAASDEVTNWMLARLKSSFDAVVTPSGSQLVLHLDQEIAIDKEPGARKLDYQRTSRRATTGDRHGLD